jgi:diacylglycerol O-acyltransferase
MAEPLSPADRSALAAEHGPVNMSVGGLLVFEGGVTRAGVVARLRGRAHLMPRPGGVTREAVVARLRERVHLMPRLRQRLAEPALGLANPVWVDDHDFDLDWHVRHTSLPRDGDDDALEALLGREMSGRLDRSRPLWELTVIDGLGDARVALLAKLHHAMADGMAALALGALLLDPTPEPLEIPPPDLEWEPQPFDVRRYVAHLAGTPFSQAQRLMLDTASRALDPDPRRAADDLRRATDLVTELARTRPQAPMTPLNEPISANRSCALVRARLSDVKQAARRAGGTVNDALLAAVAGMLQRYLAQAGPDRWNGRAPVALVPVSVRKPDEHEHLGNRISTVLVELPVDVENPLERVRAVNARMTELKESAAVRAGSLMVGAAGAAPPVVSGMLARALSGARAANLVVSNVPGPQQPFYLDGRRVLAIFPLVPLNPANQGLSLGILSYDGRVFFGLEADRGLDPPVGVAAGALREALAELTA